MNEIYHKYILFIIQSGPHKLYKNLKLKYSQNLNNLHFLSKQIDLNSFVKVNECKKREGANRSKNKDETFLTV